MRLIDADLLRDYFVDLSTEKDIGFGDRGRMITINIKHIIDVIEYAPSIDIEPKRGEWIEEHEDGHGVWVGTCNLCGKTSRVSNFCPNCGADMREREGE